MKKIFPIMRNIAVVVFIMAMAAAAELCGQHEVIFPEVGALCVGLWLMPKAVWNVRMWQVPVYLTAAALMGLVVNRFVPTCFEIRFALAFIVIFVLLRLVKCNMYPLVSASMLPVLIGTTSWVYPVSVLALSMLIAVGRKWLPQEERDEYQPYGALKTVLLVVALCIPLAVVRWAKFSPMQYLVVPPLVVTMIEFANRRSGFRARPWTIWGQIVVAAVAGVAVEYLLHRSLGLPMAVGMTIAVVAMLMSFRRFKPFAPAMAIVIVPALLPDVALLWFPLAAALGSGWFILSGMLLSRSGPGNEQDERNTSANHRKVIINRINTALHGGSRKTAMKHSISASRWG